MSENTEQALFLKNYPVLADAIKSITSEVINYFLTRENEVKALDFDINCWRWLAAQQFKDISFRIKNPLDIANTIVANAIRKINAEIKRLHEIESDESKHQNERYSARNAIGWLSFSVDQFKDIACFPSEESLYGLL